MSKKSLFYIHSFDEVPPEILESLSTFNGEVVLVRNFLDTPEVLEVGHVIIDARRGIDGQDVAEIAKRAYRISHPDNTYYEYFVLVLMPNRAITNNADISVLETETEHRVHCVKNDSFSAEYSERQRQEVSSYMLRPVGKRGLPEYQRGTTEEIHDCVEQKFKGRHNNGTVTVWKAEPYGNGFGMMEIRNFTEHFAAQIEYCPFCAEPLGVHTPVEEGTATFMKFSLQ